MSDTEQAKLLLQKANEDARALAGMLDANTFSGEIFGFHAQQAVEKALKAWLCVRGVAYPKTHDLEALLSMLTDASEAVLDRFLSLDYLPDFGVQFRYGAFLDLGDELDRHEVVRDVNELVEHVEGLIRRTEQGN